MFSASSPLFFRALPTTSLTLRHIRTRQVGIEADRHRVGATLRTAFRGSTFESQQSHAKGCNDVVGRVEHEGSIGTCCLACMRQPIRQLPCRLRNYLQGKDLTAQQERNKLRVQRRTVKAKRGYLLYVGRRGKGLLLKGRKGRYGYWFFEIPAVLENDGMKRDELKKFQKEFHRRRKFVSQH
jgi:hypothetical protein